MNDANFLQTSNHCLMCHADYFGTHEICTTTTGGNRFCAKCNAVQMIKDLDNKKWKYCPHCGKEL